MMILSGNLVAGLTKKSKSALSFPNASIGLPAEAARRQGIQKSGKILALDSRQKRSGVTSRILLVNPFV